MIPSGEDPESPCGWNHKSVGVASDGGFGYESRSVEAAPPMEWVTMGRVPGGMKTETTMRDDCPFKANIATIGKRAPLRLTAGAEASLGALDVFGVADGGGGGTVNVGTGTGNAGCEVLTRVAGSGRPASKRSTTRSSAETGAKISSATPKCRFMRRREPSTS